MGVPFDHPAILAAYERGLVVEAKPAAVAVPALPPNCSEKVFQARVIALAESNGWECYHPFDSRRSAAGYPDLTLVRGPELIYAELKTDVGRVTADQQRWQELLAAVPGVRVRLWRPRDWDAIVAELTTAEGGETR